MAVRDFVEPRLINAGRPASEPVACVQRVSTERERVTDSTLEAVAHGEVELGLLLDVDGVLPAQPRLGRLQQQRA